MLDVEERSGVTVLRLSADAVVDLWSRDDGAQSGNRTTARNEVLAEVGQVTAWYQAMATALTGSGEVPTELPPENTTMSASAPSCSRPFRRAAAVALSRRCAGISDIFRKASIRVRRPCVRT